MATYVQAVASQALSKRLAEIQAAAKPNSLVITQARQQIQDVVIQDHTETLLANKDSRGRTLAPLKPSTLKKWPGRSPNTALVPHGAASRAITAMQAVWQQEGGAWVLVKRFRDIPWMVYHLVGTRNMAKRYEDGVAPTGWARIKAIHAALPAKIARGGR